jgi:CBS domain-containing protein
MVTKRNRYENPPWWSPDSDFAWDHVKLEMERRLKAEPECGLEIISLLCQPRFREFEKAYRFGYCARLEYDEDHPDWDNALETCLHQDWEAMYPMQEQEWQTDCLAVRYGWNYATKELQGIAKREDAYFFKPAGTAMRKNMKIKNIITPSPRCISPNASVAEAAIEMKALDIGWLPICEDGRLIGTLTDRDIIIRSVAEGYDLNVMTVRRVMSRGVIYCFEDQNIEDAAQIMEMHQIRRLPVLDRNKRLVGIVSLGDLAVRTGEENLAGRILERISEPARQAA